MNRTNEAAFETVIEANLLQNGYVSVTREGFDRERAIFPETVLNFIRETQPTEWKKLEALHGAKTGEQVLADLCKWMDANGSLATLRHGFKCYGRTLRVAFFKAAHELDSELEARYAGNRLGLTRQLRFSPRSEQSVDVTLRAGKICTSFRPPSPSTWPAALTVSLPLVGSRGTWSSISARGAPMATPRQTRIADVDGRFVPETELAWTP